MGLYFIHGTLYMGLWTWGFIHETWDLMHEAVTHEALYMKLYTWHLIHGTLCMGLWTYDFMHGSLDFVRDLPHKTLCMRLYTWDTQAKQREPENLTSSTINLSVMGHPRHSQSVFKEIEIINMKCQKINVQASILAGFRVREPPREALGTMLGWGPKK